MTEQDNAIKELDNKDEVIELLKFQNQKLEKIEKYLHGLIEKEGEENDFRTRTRVTDFNMSFGAMVGFIFKWFFATLPLGFILIILYYVLFGNFGYY